MAVEQALKAGLDTCRAGLDKADDFVDKCVQGADRFKNGIFGRMLRLAPVVENFVPIVFDVIDGLGTITDCVRQVVDLIDAQNGGAATVGEISPMGPLTAILSVPSGTAAELKAATAEDIRAKALDDAKKAAAAAPPPVKAATMPAAVAAAVAAPTPENIDAAHRALEQLGTGASK